MTSSRSNGSISRRLVVLLVLVFGLGGLGTAQAEKRKRVVVLPFEGEKAEKFHAAVVKLVKKSHTVVSAEKWEGAAEDLSATKLNAANIKKVAKKLKVDGVIEGKIDKRRDEYIIKLKLHAGTSGTVAGTVNTKAEGPRLDGSASKDVKDELISAIGELDSVRGKGGDDEEEETKPVKKKKGDDEEEAKPVKKKKGDDEEEAKPVKKKKGDDEDETKPVKGSKFANGQMKKGDDEEETKPTKKKKGDDEEAKPTKKRPKKADPDGEETEVAKKGDPEEEIEAKVEPGGGTKMDKATALSPGNRAVDATIGLSLNARRLSWKHDADLQPGQGPLLGRPPAYKGVPAPGAVIDISAYPLAFGHKSHAMTKNIGINVLFDRALLISSKDVDGTKLKTASQRWAVGGLFRYPFGKSATAPVIGGRLRFGKQLFEVGGMADIPDVDYTMIDVGALFRMPVTDKIIINANASFIAIFATGEIQTTPKYGAATVSGIDVELGGDYSINSSLFARAALKVETIGYKFKGQGMLTTARDSDPEVDVNGARDTYLGVAFTVGYLY